MINMNAVADEICGTIKAARPQSRAHRIGTVADNVFSCIAGVSRDEYEAVAVEIGAIAGTHNALVNFHSDEFDSFVDVWSPVAAMVAGIDTSNVREGLARLGVLKVGEAA